MKRRHFVMSTDRRFQIVLVSMALRAPVVTPASPEAILRARQLLNAGPYPVPAGSMPALARLLDALSVLEGCRPAAVPLDIAGGWLSDPVKVRALLGLPPLPGTPWDPGEDLDAAADAVERAWAAKAGGLRAGDRVLVLPGASDTEGTAPENMTVSALHWASDPVWGVVDPIRPFPPGPSAVCVLDGGGPRPDGTTVETTLQAWQVLLDPDCHPGEESRGRVIAARSADAALACAAEWCEEGRPGLARDLLRTCARHYPADIAGVLAMLAGPGMTREEIIRARACLPPVPPGFSP